jgi:hypothetical protein
MEACERFYGICFQKTTRRRLPALLWIFLFAFNLAQAQTENGGGKDKDANEKEDEGGFIGDAARKLFQERSARLLGNPYRYSLLPIGYYDVQTGVNLGLYSRLDSRQTNPYLYRITLQIIASTKGSHKHKIIFEYPQLGGAGFGLRVRGEWERDLEARYFGIGNDSRNNQQLTDAGSANFIHEDFYLYNLKHPRLVIHGTRKIASNFILWFGIGFEQVEPQLKAGAETSFLGQDRPFGHLGGSDRYLSFRLSWDSRSDDVFPLKGFLAEFSFEPNFAAVKNNVQMASGAARVVRRVTFYRYTFSHAHFLPVRSGRLIFANRIAFEAVAGDAPYYALGEIAGERHTHVLGGSHTLRGFQSRRFQDKIKLFTLSELRYKFRSFQLWSHSFDLIFIGFVDSGRVWGRWSELALNDFHSTIGAGVWLNWNNKMILRLDVGRSKEDIIPLFRLHSAF